MIYETKIKVKSEWDWRGFQWHCQAFFKKEDAEAHIEHEKEVWGFDFLEAEIREHKRAKKGIYVGRGLGKPDRFVRAK